VRWFRPVASWVARHVAVLFVVCVLAGGVLRAVRDVELGGLILTTLAIVVLTSAFEAAAAPRHAGGDVGPVRLGVLVAAAQVGVLLIAALGLRLVPPAVRPSVAALGVAPSEIATIGLGALAGAASARAAAGVVAGSMLLTLLGAGAGLSLLGVAGHVSLIADALQLVVVVGLPGLGGLLAGRWAHRAVGRERVQELGAAALCALGFEVGSLVRPEAGAIADLAVFVLFVVVSALLAGGLVLVLPPPARAGAFVAVMVRDFAVAAGVAAVVLGRGAVGPLALYGAVAITAAAGVARLWPRVA
jgi:hypothetical protein